MRAAVILWASAWLLYELKWLVQPDKPGVYSIFAEASRHWWSGEPLYVDYPGIDIFRYPPTFAVAFSPFAALPDPIGSGLWNLLSLSLLFWALRLAVARLFPWQWSSREEGWFLVLTLCGTIRGFWSAQSNALLLALLLLACIAILEGKWWCAAFLVAVPMFIKLWPVALIMLLSVYWPRRLPGRVIVASGVLAALPFLTRPWHEVVTAYHGLYQVLVRTAPLRWHGYRDAWTIWEQIAEVDRGWYLVLQGSGALAVLGWCLWQRRVLSSDRHLLTVTVAAWASWQLLLGPATERLTYGLVAPFTSAAVILSFARHRLRGLAVAAWLMTVVLGSGGAERTLLPVFPAAPAIQPAGAAVFAIWLVAFCARHRGSSAEDC